METSPTQQQQSGRGFGATLAQHLRIPHSRYLVFGLMTMIALCSIAAVAFDQLLVLALPVLVIGAFFAISDFKNLYFLLWATIPLSTEVFLSSGIGTTLPDEPLMILVFGIGTLIFLARLGKLSFRVLLHPISIILILHLGWIALTTLFASDVVISLKFLAAKTWYIMVFYIIGYYLIRNSKDGTRWLLWVLIPVLFTVIVIMIRHGLQMFTFESINSVLNPFYRNHVNYALLLGVFFPFVWFFRRQLPGKYTGILICLFLLIAVYFTYTRAAYLGLISAFAGLIIVKWRLTRLALLVGIAALLAVFIGLAKENRYIDFAPDYKKTITHYKFDDLLQATYRFQDISTMERFYRWIAGVYMISEKPVMGFGPGNFYTSYKSYTDENFVTYVSHNPERSGMHNYFLMTAVEQGIPGVIIFIALLTVPLLKIEWLFRRVQDSYAKKMLSACTGALFFIIFTLLLNDMIETDKVGSFFFFCLAMIVGIEHRYLDNGFSSGGSELPSGQGG